VVSWGKLIPIFIKRASKETKHGDAAFRDSGPLGRRFGDPSQYEQVEGRIEKTLPKTLSPIENLILHSWGAEARRKGTIKAKVEAHASRGVLFNRSTIANDAGRKSRGEVFRKRKRGKGRGGERRKGRRTPRETGLCLWGENVRKGWEGGGDG